MAFALRNLSVLAYANGFTLWHYKAAGQEVETVRGPGFFADAADMLAQGDMVMVSGRDGARILYVAHVPGVDEPKASVAVAPLA